jgi:hypothetical protein
MKRILVLILLVTSFLAISCNNNKNKDVKAIISGPSSKTWHPSKQTDASGDKVKLTDEEKKESWIFYSNGQVSMNMTSQSMQGRWTYDPHTRVLAITPDGSTMAQTFTVKDAEEDELDLTAGDGTAMRLKTE